jgi:hypothetical protein
MSSVEDKARMSVREIRCADRLWQTFEQMSDEQEKSVEELIRDAMTAYAQLAGYETAVDTLTPEPEPAPAQARGARPQSFIPPVSGRFGRPGGSATRPSGSSAVPPPLPDALTVGATVYLVFDGQKYRIDKDQFIIGRGTKSSDLAIKDGNISRKHAAVIRRNGTFFIKDLGSTNGIDFNAMRIDNKRIDEGDVFHICEYELKFTYKR